MGHRILSRTFTRFLYIQTRNMHLLREQAFVNGLWVDAKSKAKFPVMNPAKNTEIASVPDMNTEDGAIAIDAAAEAFKSWQDYPAKTRCQLLMKWFHLLEENKEEIARIMSAESGKPYVEALGEMTYGNSFIEWSANLARFVNGEIVPSPAADRQILLTRQPIGVVGVITPWNFPHAMITRKVGALLGAGCTCVIKPAHDTPLTALAAIQLAHDAGIPSGVVNIITSSHQNAASIGKLICESPKVAGITFTGSTGVGKILYQQCSTTVKRIGLELGGLAALIVFPSADIDKAVLGGFAAKFRNCGQTCISINRFLLHEDVYDEYVAKFAEAVKTKLKMGDVADETVNIGPLINSNQLKTVSGLVSSAVELGATVITGGKVEETCGHNFYQPTILTNVTENMDIYNKEIFGPVCPFIKFKTEEEALRIANGSRFGLASYFYTQDIAQVFRVSKALEFGMVGINETMVSCTEAAFGGVKESGIGREGSVHGFDEFTYIKYNCLGGLK